VDEELETRTVHQTRQGIRQLTGERGKGGGRLQHVVIRLFL
jgi:hypothetical protein